MSGGYLITNGGGRRIRLGLDYGRSRQRRQRPIVFRDDAIESAQEQPDAGKKQSKNDEVMPDG